MDFSVEDAPLSFCIKLSQFLLWKGGHQRKIPSSTFWDLTNLKAAAKDYTSTCHSLINGWTETSIKTKLLIWMIAKLNESQIDVHVNLFLKAFRCEGFWSFVFLWSVKPSVLTLNLSRLTSCMFFWLYVFLVVWFERYLLYPVRRDLLVYKLSLDLMLNSIWFGVFKILFEESLTLQCLGVYLATFLTSWEAVRAR